MGTKAALTVEEYLRTSFPGLDREFHDGEVVERTLPDYLHSKTQGLLVALFVLLRKTFPVFVCPELRVRVAPGHYLISDLCVYSPTEPIGAVPDTPPLIAIEILSPDDRLGAVREKLDQYRAWGVAHVWLVDPHQKRMYTCDTVLTEVPTLTVPELSLEVTPAEIF
jgi:Uma2 family endonuclease